MTKAEEIYLFHYLEKFKYFYETPQKMAQHLKEIAIDAIQEALEEKRHVKPFVK